MSELQQGWVCPICGKVYSPYVEECAECNKPKNAASLPFADYGYPGYPTTTAPQAHSETRQYSDAYAALGLDEIEKQLQAQYAYTRPAIPPNTQCVDCRYGTPMMTPDGIAKSIRCEVYEGEYRSPQDTCIGNTVNVEAMTASHKEDG